MALNMITDQEFNRIYRFLKDRYGIDMEGKKVILHGRLENYLRINGYNSYTEYMNAVEKDPTRAMESELVNMLSTNHTYFMRESEHFDFLKQEVVPWIRRREAATHDLRIWCGASSTGEEPYTLEMVVRDALGLEADKWNTDILATDVSEEALHKAIAGVYDADQIAPLPETWKRRYFRALPDPGLYQVTDELKKRVIYRKFNLMNPFPFRKPMHAIFLRNVMIYFDEPTKADVIQKVYDSLLPGGYLFIGKTETIDREKIPFTMVQPAVFRKPLS